MHYEPSLHDLLPGSRRSNLETRPVAKDSLTLSQAICCLSNEPLWPQSLQSVKLMQTCVSSAVESYESLHPQQLTRSAGCQTFGSGLDCSAGLSSLGQC